MFDTFELQGMFLSISEFQFSVLVVFACISRLHVLCCVSRFACLDSVSSASRVSVLLINS